MADDDECDSCPEPSGLTLDLVHESGDWSAFGPLEPRLPPISSALAHSLALDRPVVAALALGSDESVRILNRTYRGKDAATNVLSFPTADEYAAELGDARFLGDIVLAAQTVQREADELGIPLGHHFDHLVVHGLLHLLGYDHASEDEARDMEALEVAILKTLGIPDPYADRPLL